jgi:hypothetical protein
MDVQGFADGRFGSVRQCFAEILAAQAGTGAAFAAWCDDLCRARTRAIAPSWWFLCSLCRPAILVDQAVNDVAALDLGSNIDRLAGLVQRRSLFPRLVRPMTVVMP